MKEEQNVYFLGFLENGESSTTSYSLRHFLISRTIVKNDSYLFLLLVINYYYYY